jgi:hypothetical protein
MTRRSFPRSPDSWDADWLRLLLRYAHAHDGPWDEVDELLVHPGEVDARLMAAAPALLDALRLARSMILSGESMSAQAAATIDGAIAEATRPDAS